MQNSKHKKTPSGTVCTPKQKAFLHFIEEYGAEALVESLRAVHDAALYHTELSINQREKQELFDVKLLADELEKMG